MDQQRDAKSHFFGYGVLVIGLLLSIYSGFHQFNFIQVALPPNQKEWGYFGIIAFDVGMIAWAGTALFHARGDLQPVIAWIMTGVSFFGVAAGLVMDTFLVAGQNGYSGKADKGTVDLVIWISVGVMLLHIAAGIVYIANDPSHNQRKRQEKLRAKIESEAWKMSDQQVEILAAQLAPRISGDQMNRLQARYTATLGQMPRQMPQAQQGRNRPQPKLQPKQQPPRRGSTIPARVSGMRMVFNNQQPEPPTIRYEPDSPEFMMDIATKAAKPKPTPRPAAPGQFSGYDGYEVEEPDENEYVPTDEELDAEFPTEEATDFLAQPDRDIPINHNGHRIG
jgi:hypothetical protein